MYPSSQRASAPLRCRQHLPGIAESLVEDLDCSSFDPSHSNGAQGEVNAARESFARVRDEVGPWFVQCDVGRYIASWIDETLTDVCEFAEPVDQLEASPGMSHMARSTSTLGSGTCQQQVCSKGQTPARRLHKKRMSLVDVAKRTHEGGSLLAGAQLHDAIARKHKLAASATCSNRFCSTCGCSVDVTAVFCTSCGRVIPGPGGKLQAGRPRGTPLSLYESVLG